MTKTQTRSIAAIIARLDPDENRSVIAFLTSFSRQYGDYKPKTLKIYELIFADCDIPEQKLKGIVCPEISDAAFKKLLERLKEKIFEALTLGVNVKRKEVYSKYAIALFELKRKRALVHILYGKGMREEALNIVDDCVFKAKQHYLFSDVVNFLLFKHSVIGRTVTRKKALDLEKEIAYYSELRYISEEAEFHYNSIVIIDRHNVTPHEYTLAVKEKIMHLSRFSNIEDSPIAYYYYVFLRLLYEKSMSNYVEFSQYAEQLSDILNKYKGLQHKIRMANVHIQLAEAAIFNFKFNEALASTEQAKKYLIPSTRNYMELETLAYYSMLYTNDTTTARKCVDGLYRNACKLNEDSTFTNKILYKKAYVLFIEKNYPDASRILLQLKELPSDKEGWNIGIRLLQIMIRIEQEAFEEADRYIQNLGRHLRNVRKSGYVSSRFILIANVLKALPARGFNLNSVMRHCSDELALLDSDDPAYRWNFFTPELIPFHRWLAKTAARESYSVSELIA